MKKNRLLPKPKSYSWRELTSQEIYEITIKLTELKLENYRLTKILDSSSLGRVKITP